jgi:paraquat-inducible protein B
MLFPTLPNNAMTEPENKSDSMPSSPPPQPEVRRSRQVRISWIWLVPLVAAIVGASLLFRDWMHAGPTVTIAFDSADGLEVGQTKVRYKEVVVGTVTGIKVSPDRRKALVSAQIDRESANYIAQPGSRFWVVRPRLGISGVTGLNTLLSGAYISVDTAEKPASDADAVYEFEGLEKPPEISSSRPGTRFVLQAADLGSLEIGSPVYFRRIQVGQVVGYSLDSSGKSVNVQVFVDAPYDKFVTSDARFWNASGINLSLDADGLSVQTGSLVSMVAGGVAFASPNESDTEPAKANSVFQLAGSREQAMADPDGPPFLVEMHFLQSVRGLRVGAAVDFRGLELGTVSSIDLKYDTAGQRFYALVKARLYPLRFGELYGQAEQAAKEGESAGSRLLAPMIQHGLRAQVRPANLLTGQQYVALDFFPSAEKAMVDVSKSPVELPTIAGSFDRLQQQISSIVTKFDKIPFDDIGMELRSSLEALNKVLRRVDGELGPQASAMLKSAQKSLSGLDQVLGSDMTAGGNLAGTMRELGDAARALRALAEYLETHPSSVVRGRGADPAYITP